MFVELLASGGEDLLVEGVSPEADRRQLVEIRIRFGQRQQLLAENEIGLAARAVKKMDLGF